VKVDYQDHRVLEDSLMFLLFTCMKSRNSEFIYVFHYKLIFPRYHCLFKSNYLNKFYLYSYN